MDWPTFAPSRGESSHPFGSEPEAPVISFSRPADGRAVVTRRATMARVPTQSSPRCWPVAKTVDGEPWTYLRDIPCFLPRRSARIVCSSSRRGTGP